MNQEQIIQAWNEFLKKENNSFLGSVFLKNHMCGNCKHWNLINADDLLLFQSETESNHIIQGLQGKIQKTFEEDGEVVDTYSAYKFHGWCKRYPPTINNSFPLLSHENTCGEWNKNDEENA